MANQAEIKAVITAEDKASAVLKDFGKNVDDQGNKIADVGKVAQAAVLGLGAAAVGFGITSIKAFDESEQRLSQLHAVLKSTGGAAGVTADQAVKLSKSIEHNTSLSDEAALAVENMGLTFTNIHKEVFPSFTRAAIDAATAMNGGAKPSTEQLIDVTKQLGKAMQDPDGSIGALHRMGVNTDELKNKLAGLHDNTSKQKAIIQELSNEFGGSASAQAKTFQGHVDQLKEKFNDLQEVVGNKLINTFNRMGEFYEHHKRLINDLAAAIGIVGGAIGIVVVAFGIWKFAITAVETAQKALNLVMETNPIVLAITAIIAVVLLLITHWNTTKRVAEDIWHSVSGFFSNLGRDIGNIFDGIWKAISGAFDKVKGFITGIFKAEFNGVARIWNDTIGKLHFTFPKWIPGLGGHDFSMPQIPMLAEGGIVTKPTLAMIGENGAEAVIPLNKAGGAGMGANINITVQAGAFMGSQIDARKYASQILKALQDMAASKNTTVGDLLGVNP
jgi:hypothetical protein